MRAKIALISSVSFLLGACAYGTDTSLQEIEIKTPGAQNAVCSMYIDKVRYRVHPPQKISITKSRKDLILDCMAPGNRRNKVVIEAGYSENAKYNVLNAGVGAVWDSLSGAINQYPDIIEVDFTNIPIQPSKAPKHNSSDILAPEEHMLEEFSSGVMRLNSDRYKGDVEIHRRGSGSFESDKSSSDSNAFTEDSITGGKGDLRPATNSPTPIYPGK